MLGIFHALQLKSQKLLLAELGVYVSISISIFFSVIALLSMRLLVDLYNLTWNMEII